MKEFAVQLPLSIQFFISSAPNFCNLLEYTSKPIESLKEGWSMWYSYLNEGKFWIESMCKQTFKSPGMAVQLTTFNAQIILWFELKIFFFICTSKLNHNNRSFAAPNQTCKHKNGFLKEVYAPLSQAWLELVNKNPLKENFSSN